MGTSIRLITLATAIVFFGLKPVEVHSLFMTPDQLSMWHPSDQVPCRMYLFTDNGGCICVTVLEHNCLSDRGAEAECENKSLGYSSL